MRAFGARRLLISVLAELSAQQSIFVLAGIFEHELRRWMDCGLAGVLRCLEVPYGLDRA